jgi:integrase
LTALSLVLNSGKAKRVLTSRPTRPPGCASSTRASRTRSGRRNLRWKQFDARKKTLTFLPQKTAHNSDPVTATVPVDGDLLKLLRALPRISEHILTSERRKPFANSATLSRAISDHLETIGCGKYVPHGLRHTAGTELADSGASTKEIMAVMGLKSERIAGVYTRNANRIKAAQRAIKKRAAARKAG